MNITISSNISQEPNSFSDFVCILNEPIQLVGKFEVCLNEIFYQNNFLACKGKIWLSVPHYALLSYTSESEETDEHAVNNESLLFFSKLSSLKKDFLAKIDFYHKIQNDSKLFDQTVIEIDFIAKDLYSNLKLLLHFIRKFTFYHLEILKFVEFLQNLFFEINILLNKIDSARQEDIGSLKSIYEGLQNSIEFILNLKRKPVDRILTFNVIIFEGSKAETIFSQAFEEFKNLFFIYKNSIKFKNYVKEIEIDSSLVKIFTFEKNFLKLKTNLVKEIQYLTIFSDIIESNNVFRLNEPILKIFKVEGENGEFIEKSFVKPQYLAVNKTYINKIGIQIKDRFGQLVNFYSGPVFLRLNFRRIKK